MVEFKEKHLKRLVVYILTGVFIFLLFDFYQEVQTIKKNKQEILGNAAYQTFFKNLLYRRWVAMHGGVYVPVTSDTPSNPYLDVENKDVITTDSLRLTLVNPAYMTRQAFDLSNKLGTEEVEKITSLNPINPVNAPDPWEAKVLRMFENGTESYSEFDTINGREFYRYMHSLVVEESCLQCHQYQGYKLGDLRGGISVAISTEIYRERGERFIWSEARSNLFIFILLIGVVSAFYWYVKRMLNKELSLKREKDLKNIEIEQFFEHTPISIFVVNDNMHLINANTLGKEIIGVNRLPRNKITIGQAIGCGYFEQVGACTNYLKCCTKYQKGKKCSLAEMIKYALASGRNQFKKELFIDINSGTEIEKRSYVVSIVLLNQDNHKNVLLMMDDVTETAKNAKELKRINARLKSVESIIYYKAKSTNDLLDGALKEIINYTSSDTGAVYHYDSIKDLFILNNWSDSYSLTLDNHSNLSSDLECLSSAVKLRQPIIRNKLNKGYSFYKKGANKDLKSLTIPIIRDGKILAVVWVASKTKSYSDFDAQQITLLLDATWVLFERMNLMEKAL